MAPEVGRFFHPKTDSLLQFRGDLEEIKEMKKVTWSLLPASMIATLLLGACAVSSAPAPAAPVQPASTAAPTVLAVETFLADIAQNVAGDRLKVDALIPIGVDPHAFEPTPQDVARIAGSQVLVANGAGFEGWLAKMLANAGGKRLVVEAAAGLPSRQPREGEIVDPDHAETDPHFWLDPVSVIKYTENIRDGLSQADPAGKELYTKNAEAYIGKLRELDAWISGQVQQVPEARRLLVTNHESFGYFADRYGFRVVGTVIPSVSTGASPSAQQLTSLVDRLKATNAPAIFLETGANPQLANQLAQEIGIKIVTDLYTHSVTESGGNAPTYIDMMRYNVQKIVDALK
jgi:ABC-type Zn uptake system ZnuABC Zn-binding protein ZnuA